MDFTDKTPAELDEMIKAATEAKEAVRAKAIADLKARWEVEADEAGLTLAEVVGTGKPKKKSTPKGKGRHIYINRDTGETSAGRGSLENKPNWLPPSSDPKRAQFRMTDAEQAEWDAANGH